MVVLVTTFGCNVVNMIFHCLLQVIAKDHTHCMLVGGAAILQEEWHHRIEKQT